jgi:hypothetical protein
MRFRQRRGSASVTVAGLVASEPIPLIVLEPARWERREELHDAYDALVEDIRKLGFEVELREAVERRRGATTFTAPLADLVVYLGPSVEEDVVEAIVTAVVTRVGGKAGWPRKRAAIIVAADGETVLQRVKLSDPD